MQPVQGEQGDLAESGLTSNEQTSASMVSTLSTATLPVSVAIAPIQAQIAFEEAVGDSRDTVFDEYQAEDLHSNIK